MSTTLKPVTIEKLGSAVYPALAMVAGMQLDLFTPLGTGPMSAKQLAEAMGLEPAKLTQLLYVLEAIRGQAPNRDGKGGDKAIGACPLIAPLSPYCPASKEESLFLGFPQNLLPR